MEQTTIDQQSIASSTQLDTPMAVPTQETGANTLNTLNQMTVNRDESTQMPSQEIQLEGINQSTQMPSQHLHSTGTQDNERTIPGRAETIPTTSNNQEVSIDHIIWRRSYIVPTTSNTVMDNNQTGKHNPTTPPNQISIRGNPGDKEVSHPLPTQARTGQHRPFIVPTISNAPQNANRAGTYAHTTLLDRTKIGGDPEKKEVSHPLHNQAYTSLEDTPGTSISITTRQRSNSPGISPVTNMAPSNKNINYTGED